MNAKLEENMLLDVIKVNAKENFTLELEFENGECIDTIMLDYLLNFID